MIRLTTTTMRMTARPRRPATADRSASATRSGGGTRDQGRRTKDQGPKGFTLIELMVVIIILAILVALLLPAIGAAMRTARNAAVSSEINLLAQALESFKAKYGDYPPSRFLAVENGDYRTYLGDTTTLKGGTLTDPTSPGSGDISLGQLAQRSVSVLRKFFPRVSTTGLPTTVWYDFNGNGVRDPLPYILHGHECLVFFLGGVPSPNNLTGPPTSFGMTGFGKDPTNPFTNNIASDPRAPYNGSPNAMYNPNRQPSFFEFNAGRLFLDPINPAAGIPGYYDSLNNAPPPPSAIPAPTLNFYAYFSAYGNGGYDPNDVNVPELDDTTQLPIGLKYLVSFPVYYPSPPGGTGPDVSPAPNPYTSTTTVTTSGTVTFQKPQTYQIISSGIDGLYGVGGQYQQASTAAAVSLPLDSINIVNTADTTIRQREQDNLTNFTSGKLQ